MMTWVWLIWLFMGALFTKADESYEENAYREAEEELGVKGVPMEHLFTFYYEASAVIMDC